MIFQSLIGGILYKFITCVLVAAIVSTSSFPVIQHLPGATSAYLGMMQKLGLFEADATSRDGFRSTAPAGMEALVPSLDKNGEPVGFLLNADALQMNQAGFAPPSLADPLSVSRAQSAYAQTDVLSHTLTITFTVTNNRPPSLTLDLPVSATITDTIAAVSAVDFSDDPNVIRNVLLTDDLLPANAVFVAADPLPDRVPPVGGDGDALAWNLGDVPPLGSVTATLTVAIPAGPSSDFIALDGGAAAWGSLQGRMVVALTAPASLAPDGFGDWLQWTVDADYYDEYMLKKAAELGNDWQQMFAYVRSLGYESYKGSLRGTRGTLWSEAGNSLDQASLLIAMLRGSGIPARYRHGTLSTARAQALILSMFPEPTGVIGHIPAGTEVADPANDPQLLSETTDHWWVEAYLPGSGWTNLDPCFAEALPGQTFHASLATDGTDQIPEVPDSLRHKVTMTLKVEDYHPLNIGNSGLSYSYPLSHTFNTVELSGDTVTLRHLVNTDGATGMVFYWLQHTYTPYFTVSDSETALEGQSFQEMVSNFPLSTRIVTAEWLLFDVSDANGNREHYERAIVDRVGFDARQGGGTLNVGESVGTEAVVSPFDAHSVLVSVSGTPDDLGDGQSTASFQELAPILTELQEEWSLLDKEDTVQVQDFISRYRPVLYRLQNELLKKMGYAFYKYSDNVRQMYAQSMVSKSYPDKPKFVLLSQYMQPEAPFQTGYDLLQTKERVLAAPQQAAASTKITQLLSGGTDTALENELIYRFTRRQPISAMSVFLAAEEQGIDIQSITMDTLDTLAGLEISQEAKARITQAVRDGKTVLVPGRMLTIQDKVTIAWWEVDSSGYMTGVMENGWHCALMNYVNNLWYTMMASQGLSIVAGFIYTGLFFLGTWFSLAVEGPPGTDPGDVICGLLDCDPGGAAVVAFFITLVHVAGCIWAPMNLFLIGALIALTLIWGIIVHNAPPPPPALLRGFSNSVLKRRLTAEMRYPDFANVRRKSSHLPQAHPLIPFYVNVSSGSQNMTSVIGVLPVARTRISAQVHLSMQTESLVLDGYLAPQWQATAQSSLQYGALSSPSGMLYNAQQVFVGNGLIQVTPFVSLSLATATLSSHSAVLSGSGFATLYAPATRGLGVGTNWLTYTAELTATQPYTLTLYDAVVTVNNTDVYTGDFTLVTTATTTLTGSGHTAAPNFAPSLSGEAQDARISTGPAAGTFLVGGEAVDVSNGVAIAGYTGPLTVTEANATQDRIELAGEADFFTLHTSPAANTTDPNTPAVFQAVIDANFDDTYTVTVEAPEGWNVELDATGVVTATPPLGTKPGAYTLLVTAQSGAYPDLFASAEHTVNTIAYQGMEMDVAPDPLITIPFGEADPAAFPGDTNNGQMQIPGAAFTVDITNTSTTSHTFQVTIGGLPAGWLILSGAEGLTQTTITLPPGGVGQVGLYVAPAGDTLPPVDTEYPFDVTVVALDSPTLQESDSDAFVVPALAFNHITADPAEVYVTADTAAFFDLSVRNVGNADGNFPVLVSTPPSWTVAVPQLPVAVPAGATVVQTLAFTTTGASLGDRRMLEVASPAPGTAYTQTTAVLVNVVGPCVGQAYRSAQAVALWDDAILSQHLANLATQLGRWERSPEDAALRERTVAALNALIAYLQEAYPLLDTADLAALAAAPTIAGFCGPLSALEDVLDRIGRRRVVATLRPGYTATLPDLPITYTVSLENRGTLTTSYAVQVSGTAGLQITEPAASFTIALAPGETYSTPVVAVSGNLGQYALAVQAQAVADSLIQARATSGLKVVDAFIRVTDVSSDPPFVEVGANTAGLYASVANVANIYLTGQARVSVIAEGGAAMFTNTVPLTIPSSLHWTSHALGSVNVAGWNKGVYSVTVQMVDNQGRLIPDGTGVGSLVVGEGVVASVTTTPEEVAPGDAIVTTAITTERTAGVEGAPVDGMNNVYTFYLPDDTWHTEDYDGFYVVGLRPISQYQVQRFDESAGSWVSVVTETVTMDDIKLYFTGYPPDTLYRVYADNPVLIVVTSGEGSLVSAATPDLKFKGKHFTFVGDYANVLSWSRLVVFGLENDTTVNVELRAPGGEWSVPDTQSLQAGAYWYYQKDTDNTTFVRVTADKDVIVYRVSGDNDELDTVMADTGTPYGTTFYFAPVPDQYGNVFLLYNTESSAAQVTIYSIDNPASPVSAWQGTVPALGAVSAVPNQGSYFKIVSDRTLSVIGGGVVSPQLVPGGSSEDAIWELLETQMGNRYLYQTNLLYSRGMSLVQEYTEFDTGLRGQTEILTEIPLVDKNSDTLWGSNTLNYLASAPVSLTLEIVTHTAPTGLYRREESFGVEYTPSTWTRSSNTRASRGYYASSNTTGQAASLDFEGSWVGLGFLTAVSGGYAGVFIDGVSYGTVDTYSRNDNVKSVYYDGLSSGSHTISVTVMGTRQPNSSGNWVRLDYVDTWNGDPPEGAFEADDARVISSGDWSQDVFAGASGGDYYRDGSNVWFGFAGDSVTYRTVATSWGGEVEVLVDGGLLTRVSLWNSTTISRTFSFDGLGSGPHVLQIRQYRGRGILDTFVTPGTPPFYTPPARTGVVRYEEDDALLRYNGAPYEQMPQNWVMWNDTTWLSDGYGAYTDAASQTVSLTFTGTWVGLGYVASTNAGDIEVLIDGVRRDVLDTYRRTPQSQSIYYDGLAAGEHTIVARARGTKNPNSSGTRLHFDYFDVWDGTVIPAGQSETPFAMTWNWTDSADAVASGGQYYRDGTAVWYAFTGDSVTYQALATSWAGEADVFVDGEMLGRVSIWNSTTTTRTYSFSGLGAGPHVLQIHQYRGRVTADAFVAPGAPPFYTPPAYTGIVRYEEDHAAIRYNGSTYEQMPQNWTVWNDSSLTSDGYGAYTDPAGQTVSMTFTGTWVGLGYVASTNCGKVEVLIDGVSRGEVDTYARSAKPQSAYYDGLAAGEHTIVVRTLGTRNPNSSGTRFHFDFFDVWDGTSLPSGKSETPFAMTWNWTDAADAVASGGQYYRDGTAVWYAFTGDSVMYQTLATSWGGEVEVLVDGELLARVSDWNSATITRPYSFNGLGAGPHVLQIRSYRGRATVDAFVAPGTAPFYTPPVYTGIVRYEEEHAALLYNGSPLEQMPQNWAVWNDNAQTSDGYGAYTDPVSQTVSLTFTGTWVGLGYVAGPNCGKVEVLIDGVSHGEVDTYASSAKPQSRYYGGLASGTHTIVVQTLGTKNPSSSSSRFHFDYFDVWDGTSLPTGKSETPFASTWNWADSTDGAASGGRYYRDGTAMWYAFTGDSATYQALATSWAGSVEISVDGITRSVVSLYNATTVTRTFDFTGLGAGPHMLQVRVYSGRATVDAFAAPAGSLLLLAPASAPRVAPLAPSWQMPPLFRRMIERNAEPGGSPARPGALPATPEPSGSGRAPGFAHPVALAPVNGPFGSVEPVYELQLADTVETHLTLDGVVLPIITEPGIYTITLPAGRHTLNLRDDFGNVTLIGVEMERNAALVWNLYEVPQAARTGVYSSKFWTFLADEPMQIKQGGSGNCWIHTMFPYNYGESYAITLDHTAPLVGVAIITPTFSASPLTSTQSAQAITYTWKYDLIPSESAHTTSFDATLAGMQSGETRRVSDRTVVDYATLGGHGHIVIGPRYVSAPHIVAIAPPTRTTNPGGQAHYGVTLYNPGSFADVYSLALEGLPSGWTAPSLTTPIAAGAEVTAPLLISVPSGAELGDYDFAVVVETATGGRDSAQARVVVADLMKMAVEPPFRAAGHGDVVTYTLTITNLESVDRTYTLAVDGLAGNDSEAPAAVGVEAGASITVMLSVTALAPLGQYPFQATATYTTPDQIAAARAGAALAVLSESGVRVGLDPAVAVGGRGAPAIYTTTVTNVGSVADTYALSVETPAGWSAELSANARPVDAIALTPHLFNAAPLQLLVTPAADAAPGVYTFTVSAVSQNDASTFDVAVGTTVVSGYGVTVQIAPQSTTMDPPGARSWDVHITNTGMQADTFDLMAGGIVSSTAQFTPNPVSLAAGESTVVQLASGPLAFALPHTYPFAVTAQSQGDADVVDFDEAEVAFTGFEAVDAGVLPAAQTLTDTYEATYLMVITNTGNTSAQYVLNASANPALGLEFEVDAVYIPPHMAAGILVTARASAGGMYAITLQADSTTPNSLASDSVAATLTIVAAGNHPPAVEAGPDQTVVVGDPAQFAGAFADPDPGDTHTVAWAFGDGQTLTGTLTPLHIYTSAGVYPVTLAVTDNHGSVGADSLVVTVTGGAANVAPVFTSIPITAAVQDASYTYAVAAADANGDALAITAPTLPGWLTLTDHGDGTATLTGTPGASDLGAHAVVLRVSDGELSADQVFAITVVDVATNVAPQFTSAPVTVAAQDALYTYTATTFDANGDALAITAPALPGWLAFTDHGDGTATLAGAPSAADLGAHAVVLRVSDGALTAAQAFTITVTGGAVNVAPVFTSIPITAAVQDAPYTYAVAAADANGDALAITAPALPGWLALTDHGDGTATLAGTPGASDLGAHSVVLRVSDGALSADQVFVITVVDVATNVAPQFTSAPVTVAAQDALYTYTAATFDANGDALAITAPALPGWLALTDHGDGTAALTGTPDASDLGAHAVVLRVTDGELAATQSFTIVVTAGTVNVAPQFTSAPVIFATPDARYTYAAAAADADGDTLTITAPTLPGWLALSDHGDGTATLTGTPGAAQLGGHPVVLRVSDGELTAEQAFTVTVTLKGLPHLYLPIVMRNAGATPLLYLPIVMRHLP